MQILLLHNSETSSLNDFSFDTQGKFYETVKITLKIGVVIENFKVCCNVNM